MKNNGLQCENSSRRFAPYIPGSDFGADATKKPSPAYAIEMLPIAALLVSGFAHHATRYLPARAGFPRRVALSTPTVVADGQASTTVVHGQRRAP